MPTGSAALPQLEADVFLTDGGIETTLIFDDGIELADFAAFALVDDPAGRAALVRYFDRYAAIAGPTASASSWRPRPGGPALTGRARQARRRASSAALNRRPSPC